MSAKDVSPITEADLHAYADEQLDAERRRAVEAYLAAHPEKAELVAAWRRDNAALRAMLDPVLDEPIPISLSTRRPPRTLPWRQVAAAAALAIVSAWGGWMLRDALMPHQGPLPNDALVALAHRAAIAHAVYTPEVRRPVEVGAAQEDQLVAWLSKRLGAQLRPPRLSALGYDLMGGRLLPGREGPVAQFMYENAQAQRLTLYVTREYAGNSGTAFRFAREGDVNVFYWIDGRFGYAISADADKAVLQRVADEVYRQLTKG